MTKRTANGGSRSACSWGRRKNTKEGRPRSTPDKPGGGGENPICKTPQLREGAREEDFKKEQLHRSGLDRLEFQRD